MSTNSGWGWGALLAVGWLCSGCPDSDGSPPHFKLPKEPPATVEEFCHDFHAADGECHGVRADLWLEGNAHTINEYCSALQGDVREGLMTYEPSKALACLKQRFSECKTSVRYEDDRCREVVVGHRQTGDSCTVTYQCEGKSHCRSTCFGTCKPYTLVGEICSAGTACEPGAACDPSQYPNVCVWMSKQGEPCGSVGCLAPLTCDERSRTCVAPPKCSPVGKGCSSDAECCKFSYCSGGTCKAYARLGEPCQQEFCLGSYCGGLSLGCQPLKAGGQSCTVLNPHGITANYECEGGVCERTDLTRAHCTDMCVSPAP